MGTRLRRALAFTTLLALLVAASTAGAVATPRADLLARTASSSGENDAAPVWSADGTRIAFSDQAASGSFQVYVIDANGTQRRQVSHGTLNYGYVAWSPTGKQIGFSGLTNSQLVTAGHVYVASAAGGGQDALTTGSGWYDELFGWAPDGTTLYFDRITNGLGAIYTMDGDGTNLHELTPSPADDDYWAVWSPDGTRIAFDRTGSGASAGGDIWVMNADGSDQKRLTDNPDDNFGSAWSPNSTQIAFMSNRTGRYEIYLMSAGGGLQKRLTSIVGGAGEPRWSPDGQEIVYEAEVAGNEQVFEMSASGATQRELTPTSDGQNSDPAWSPDGKQIAFLSTRDGGTDIYVMNADGSDQRRLT